ncbi:ATP12 family protein [uncultured Albimonas sp.]|uniref:ATP12 family chaperone protein n=1 Tax=uncultured Albimonas sp. TaxID=1331701 RepID=UPI0030EBCC84|tara:strand:+ start:695 stop:1399 length:705 start_codon:yes stop_codon:yes gene_type:complete
MAAPKRFWTQAAATQTAEGWGVALDGRPLRTPGKAALIAPTRALAEALAAEWDAQTEIVDPSSMPLTRSVNTAIDRVADKHAEVVEAVAAYAGSDLLCYRAPHPARLAARQAEAWDPLLDWAAREHGARLLCAEGVMHVSQPEAALVRLHAATAAHDPLALVALHELTVLSGSLVIALAVSAGQIGAEDGWARSRVDEEWQAEQWGEDGEAAAMAARKRADFLAARRLLDLISD